MSSAMITRMFGFACSCACEEVVVVKMLAPTIMAAVMHLVTEFIDCSFSPDLRERTSLGSRLPVLLDGSARSLGGRRPAAQPVWAYQSLPFFISRTCWTTCSRL